MSAKGGLNALGELTLGSLEVRLATSAAEVDAAQALRYRVFYEEMHAKADADTAARKRDADALDQHCDHLLVLDRARPAADQIIGTYRIIRRQAADKHGKFYSSDEYDISCLIDYPGEIMELGRSCVATGYRGRPTMQLLWRGLAAYVFHYDIRLLFGCASLPGDDPTRHAEALSYLYYHHLAPPVIRAKALPHRYVDMRMLPPQSVARSTDLDSVQIDPRLGGNDLPPLIKGYLRVGGFVGDGAVIDHQFNTTDICIIVKTDLMSDRYAKHYGLAGSGSAE